MQETKSKSHFVYEKAAKKPAYKVYLLFLDFLSLTHKAKRRNIYGASQEELINSH